MTRAEVLDWLEARRPAPPPDLASKLAWCVATAPESVFAGDAVAPVVGELGTWLLRAVLERQKTAHDAAMDLLAADAWVTYAFEAASEEGTDVTGLATGLLAKVRA